MCTLSYDPKTAFYFLSFGAKMPLLLCFRWLSSLATEVGLRPALDVTTIAILNVATIVISNHCEHLHLFSHL